MKIKLTKQAKDKITAYTQTAEGEISGIGKADFDGENWIVSDFIIFEQEVSASETEFKSSELAKFIFQLEKKGEDPKKWCVWWHSHATMGVFWSGTDDDTIKNFYNSDYILSIVTNKDQEYLARLDIFKPCPVTINDIPIVSQYEIDPKILKQCKKDIKKKVKKTTYQFSWGDTLTYDEPKKIKGYTPEEIKESEIFTREEIVTALNTEKSLKSKKGVKHYSRVLSLYDKNELSKTK